MLRKKGVVGKFVEFYGAGLASLPLADRATIANMAPEYGATCGIFPVDAETLRYLQLTGRPDAQRRAGRGLLQGAGAVPRREHARGRRTPTRWSSTSRTVEPSLAGPTRPQDRVALARREEVVRRGAAEAARHGRRPSRTAGADAQSEPARRRRRRTPVGRARRSAGDADAPSTSTHGSVVIAAITSCTNTSNPSVMIAAGLLAKKAVEQGPDSEAVGQDEPRPRLEGRHRLPERRRADAVPRAAAASTSSATAARPASATAARCPTAISQGDRRRRPRRRRGALSGNRNFEGRVHPEVRANYLASPPLVVAYALAGAMDIDLHERAARHRHGRQAGLPQGHLADAAGGPATRSTQSRHAGDVPQGVRRGLRGRRAAGSARRCPRATSTPGTTQSTYVKNPPYFDGMTDAARRRSTDITGARVLAVLGDSITTDHISPAGSIKAHEPGRAST